jgi:outer membrane protein insertion porin family
MVSSRILLAATISTWLAVPALSGPAWAQTPPGNEPPPAAPSNIPGPTPPARTNPANPAPSQAPAPAPDRSVVPAAPAPAPTQAPATPPAAAVPAPATPPPVQAPAAAPGQATLCGQPVPTPARMPPSGSPPVILSIAPCFEKQGGVSSVEAATYLYYIQTRPSLPSQNQWVPYDAAAEDRLRSDFRSLWATNFLDDLSIEVTDYNFPNGVVGKLIKYDLEERQRIKIVDYTGSKQLESTKIDEKLKEESVTIRLDSFVDDALIRRVKGIVKAMLSEKGFLDSSVTHAITPVTSGTKTVNLTFTIKEGPKYKIRAIDFVGNKDVSDRKLRGKMKDTKAMAMWSFITQRGTYKEDKYAEDAEKVVGYYRDNGYLRVRVDNPEVRTILDTKDGKTRFVELKIPVTEGPRYKVGEVKVADNKVVKAEPLVQVFNLKPGKYYSEKRVKKGMEKAREIYGSIGYFEFTAYPDFSFRDLPKDAQPRNMEEAQRATAAPDAKPGPAIVDVTMHMQEGEQYFVNRITFLGNTTTHDNVIRREMQLVESGVFNTEALKQSVKHLNQLGYFKSLEGNENVQVDKTPNEKNKVDVSLKLEEQNRNQLTFGAGVSQFEGAFAQFAFQTSNFLGKGETLSVSVLTGKRYKDYQLSFSEPYLFDRPITGGINIFNRTINYIGAFTQESSGGNVLTGFRLASFSRAFMSYSYERVGISNLNAIYTEDPTIADRNPFLKDALLLGTPGGKRIISKVSPSFVHNTVDNPIFPSAGRRLTASFDLAGLGGNTSFYKPRLEAIQYWQQTRKLSAGFRAQFEFVAPLRDTVYLPIFERLVQGGEYSIRGYDIRTIGKRDEVTGLVIGGNKSLLLNGEYVYQIAGPVRVLAFFDAGQVRDNGEGFRSDAFIASTGGEVRFFMPVLNVPFRLIFARNINREGILDNNYQPEKKWRFRFAVGSTF